MRSAIQWILLATAGFAIPACVASAQATEASIVGARVDGPSRGVYFDAPLEVDWQGLCRSRLPWAFRPLTAERVQTIQRSYCEPCGSSSLLFRAPAPDAAERPQAYFVGVGSVYRVDTFELSGEVRFAMRSFDDEPRFEQCRGEAVHTPDGPVGDLVGGFVVLTRGTTVTHLQSDLPLEASLGEGGATVRLRTAERDRQTTIPHMGEATVLHSDLVAVGEQRFLFIQWAPDEACAKRCCRERFSLFEVEDGLELVGTHNYACDL